MERPPRPSADQSPLVPRPSPPQARPAPHPARSSTHPEAGARPWRSASSCTRRAARCCSRGSASRPRTPCGSPRSSPRWGCPADLWGGQGASTPGERNSHPGPWALGGDGGGVPRCLSSLPRATWSRTLHPALVLAPTATLARPEIQRAPRALHPEGRASGSSRAQSRSGGWGAAPPPSAPTPPGAGYQERNKEAKGLCSPRPPCTLNPTPHRSPS